MRDSTKPASFSTRRCFETEGCERSSSCSSSPTERSDASSRLKIARRLGSATIANADSMRDIYPRTYIPVKSCESALGRLLRLRLGAVERDRLADERLEGGGVHLFAFLDVDRAAGAAL